MSSGKNIAALALTAGGIFALSRVFAGDGTQRAWSDTYALPGIATQLLAELNPVAAAAVKPLLIDLYKSGHLVTWYSGWRPESTTYHRYGMALDLNLTRPDGSALRKAGATKSDWQPIADMAAKWGLRWGGNFQEIDINHFDLGDSQGKRITQLRALEQQQPGVPTNRLTIA